jgi:hypothetical protein
MPENTIYVGRPTEWGNPYYVGYKGCAEEPLMTREEAIECFKQYRLPDLDLEPLRGKNLACWCPLTLPCHADILLSVINTEQSEVER